MLQADIVALQDPSYIPDGSNGVYIIFLIIGIIDYFSVPTVAEWIIQSGGGASGAMGSIARAGVFTTGVGGAVAENLMGRAIGGGKSSGGSESGGSGGGSPNGQNYQTQGGRWPYAVNRLFINFNH